MSAILETETAHQVSELKRGVSDEPLVVLRCAKYVDAVRAISEVEAAGIEKGQLRVVAHGLHFADVDPNHVTQVFASILRSGLLGAVIASVQLLALSTLDWLDPLISFGTMTLFALSLGAFLGVCFGFLWWWAGISLRPFAASGEPFANHFDVVAENASTKKAAARLLR